MSDQIKPPSIAERAYRVGPSELRLVWVNMLCVSCPPEGEEGFFEFSDGSSLWAYPDGRAGFYSIPARRDEVIAEALKPIADREALESELPTRAMLRALRMNLEAVLLSLSDEEFERVTTDGSLTAQISAAVDI